MKNIEKKGLKNTIFFFIFLIIVIIPFVILELSLRWAGYGADTRVFLKARLVPGLYYENLNISDKYLARQGGAKVKPIDGLIRNIFYSPKAEGTLRGFIIGESTAQGYPYECNQSFGKIVEFALKKGGKYKNVEIINLGASAMSSFYTLDIAGKIRGYEPDFILIYAGHNEYYGNISETTGGNYLTKSLYILMKESRIFQLVFNLFSRDGIKGNSTLMERQYKEKRIPKDDITDKRVAGIFLKNIGKIIRMYSGRKIPVIVVEPVCNLIDMPPFAGKGDQDFSGFIVKYVTVLNSKNKKDISAFFEERKKHSEYDSNANIVYLDACAAAFLSGKTDLERYIAAKDIDTVPFRVRSGLQKGLEEYYNGKKEEMKNFYFIPLEDILRKDYGDAIFGGSIFIDQLHFNMKGQKIIAGIIAKKLADVFSFDERGKIEISAYLTNDRQIDEDIHFLPAYGLEAERKISGLVSRPPFSDMMIRYNLVRSRYDDRLTGLFDSTYKNYINPVVYGNFYVGNGDVETARKYVEAGIFVYPGNYYMYTARAKFEEMIDNNPEKSAKSYLLAYLLSERNAAIYKDMAAYFTRINHRDWLEEFDRLYGKPPAR